MMLDKIICPVCGNFGMYNYNTKYYTTECTLNPFMSVHDFIEENREFVLELTPMSSGDYAVNLPIEGVHVISSGDVDTYAIKCPHCGYREEYERKVVNE